MYHLRAAKVSFSAEQNDISNASGALSQGLLRELVADGRRTSAELQDAAILVHRIKNAQWL